MPPTARAHQARLDNPALPACIRCRYYEAAPTDQDAGECRINPPMTVTTTCGSDHDFDARFEAMAVWPGVTPWQWCGGFEAALAVASAMRGER